MKNKLVCYAFGRGEHWEAICVDFDLAVSGRSFRDVQERLNGVVETYIQDAAKEDPETAGRLLNRRAPFHLRAKLAVRLLWNLLSGGSSSDGDHYAGYDIPCRA